MKEIVELLLISGSVQRRYLIGADRHTPEIVELWSPLVSRLMDAPAERLYHGMVGMPYWEASLELPKRLQHPELMGDFLCVYDSPEAENPYYVGLMLREWTPLAAGSVMLACAISGGLNGLPVVCKEAEHSCPCLVGAYHAPGLALCGDAQVAAQSAGECAAILAQIFLSA